MACGLLYGDTRSTAAAMIVTKCFQLTLKMEMKVMGTDIHTVAQVYTDSGIWEDISGQYTLDDRRYTWFTFLDGTRSYITNEVRKYGVEPISEPRGCPPDFTTNESTNVYDCNTTHAGMWMGYGVSSWVLYSEILEHAPKYKHLPWDIGPLDELARIFQGQDPARCRLVFGYDS